MNFLLKSLLFASLFSLLHKCSVPKEAAAAAPQAPPRLVWSDEFDMPGLPDSTRWGYDYGTGCPEVCGWGNNELQFYTARRRENARVEGGSLIIEARREQWEGKGYTSARLVSKHKGDWTGGRIEARLKCPVGRGTWPAFWMLPTDWKYGGWPRSGEIDIMEHVGCVADSVFGSAHTQAFNHLRRTQSTGGFYLPDAEKNFHVYAVEWRPDRLDYFVDDVKYHSFNNLRKTPDEWPFDQRFHVILNLAVGGNWGGMRGVDESIWPRRLEVDYVRVYAF
jgi:beta-glucanase (GH16 family)